MYLSWGPQNQHANWEPEHGTQGRVSARYAWIERNREKAVGVSKHPVVYWNVGESRLCEVMSCHPAPPQKTLKLSIPLVSGW